MANYPNTTAGLTAAQLRAQTLMANRTWQEAIGCRDINGNVGINFIRWMTKNPAAGTIQGTWVFTRDDATV